MNHLQIVGSVISAISCLVLVAMTFDGVENEFFSWVLWTLMFFVSTDVITSNGEKHG